MPLPVVVATTKVRIFKQITTCKRVHRFGELLLLLPQRYVFSSKSQHERKYGAKIAGCCCYHKGTYFQANHNFSSCFKTLCWLLLLPQRYVFSSKSQLNSILNLLYMSCCCYHKGTYFQANHNTSRY